MNASFSSDTTAIDTSGYAYDYMRDFFLAYVVLVSVIMTACLGCVWVPVALKFFYEYGYVKGLTRSIVLRRIFCLPVVVPAAVVTEHSTSNEAVPVVASSHDMTYEHMVRNGMIDIARSDNSIRYVVNVQQDGVTGESAVTYFQTSMSFLNLAASECYVCRDGKCDVAFVPCGHGMCSQCMLDCVDRGMYNCGSCRTPIASTLCSKDFIPVDVRGFRHHMEVTMEYDIVHNENQMLRRDLQRANEQNVVLQQENSRLKYENEGISNQSLNNLVLYMENLVLKSKVQIGITKANTNIRRANYYAHSLYTAVELGANGVEASIASLEKQVSRLASDVDVFVLCKGLAKMSL